MKPVYFSEKTNKYYDTKDACETAEAKYDKEHAAEAARRNQRKTDSDKVKTAYDHYCDICRKNYHEIEEAREAYDKAREDFVKKYGSYHMTITTSDPTIADIFRPLREILGDFFGD